MKAQHSGFMDLVIFVGNCFDKKATLGFGKLAERVITKMVALRCRRQGGQA